MTSSSITTSSHINIIININITSYQLMSSIEISSVSHTPHTHIQFMPEIHTPQVFRQHKSNRTMMLFINNRYIASHQFMQQGHTYIPIVRFPPTMVLKTVNNNKLPSLIYIPLLVPCGVVLRSLRFMSVRPNVELYIPNQR